MKTQGTSGRDPVDPGGEAARAVPLASAPPLDLGGLALPGGGRPSSSAVDAGPAVTPEGRKELRAALDQAIADDRLDEAIATADVLSVLYPGDPEILELRGRVLSLQGDADGSARDLARCCELGRATCCAGKPR
jgi:hypothetical protein